MRSALTHKARRFASSLMARAPSAADTEWAHTLLGEYERRAFDRMSPKDKAHSIGVARAVERHLDSHPEPDADTGTTDTGTADTGTADTGTGPHERREWMLAAALTHDVGKSVARLGTYGRVVATLCAATAGESMAPLWAEKRGTVRRIGLYLQYPQLGADILALADSDPRVIAWAAQHHLPEEEWSVPVHDGRVLLAADDGRL